VDVEVINVVAELAAAIGSVEVVVVVEFERVV
jgi:hypothetical protein